jgi:hypothetical protein
VCNLSPHIQSFYVLQVSIFARHFGRSPEELGPEEIRAWQPRSLFSKPDAASSRQQRSFFTTYSET